MFFSFLNNKTLFKYISSSFLSVPVSLVTGFISFRSIDPYFMGIWATLTVFETYATFLRLGVVNGMNRELPHSLGAGKKDTAVKYAETTLAFTIIDIAVILIISIAIFWHYPFNKMYVAGIIVCVSRIILSFYISYLTGTFRSDDNFNKLSNIQFSLLLLKLILCPLVLIGFYGFLIYELLLFLINALLLHKFRPLKVLPKFHFVQFKELIKIGMPIFITSYLLSFVDTFPRLFIIRYSNENMLGLYAPVILLLSTVSILPNTLTAYFYPKFSYQVGKSSDIKFIWQSFLKIYAVSFLFIVISCIIVYFLIDYFVLIFPKYASSLPYLKIALLICPFVFFKMGNMLNTVFKKYNYMVYFAIIYAIIQVISLAVFSSLFSDVLEIAIYSQVVTAFLLLVISLFMNYILISAEVNKNAVLN